MYSLQELIASMRSVFTTDQIKRLMRPAREVAGPDLFLGQHTNPAANARRLRKRQIGHRQYRLVMKAVRRNEKAARELLS